MCCYESAVRRIALHASVQAAVILLVARVTKYVVFSTYSLASIVENIDHIPVVPFKVLVNLARSIREHVYNILSHKIKHGIPKTTFRRLILLLHTTVPLIT